MFVPMEAKNSALLMVDIQEHLMPLISGREAVLRNVVRLLTAVRVLNLPLLVTEQYPKGIGPTLLQLSSLLPPGTPRIEKTSFSCCGHAGFDEALDALDRDKKGVRKKRIRAIGQQAIIRRRFFEKTHAFR